MVRLDPLFDELTDGICISDGDGNILYMNPAAKRMMDVPEPAKETLNTCQLLCGRLFASGSEACAAHCALRDRGSAQKSVTFAGRHGPRSSFEWKNFNIRRFDRWGHLRVRCLKGSGRLLGLGDEDRHFTLIEDASVEMEFSRRKEDWRLMVAHDLRSPLTNVQATLLLLQEMAAGEPLGAKEKELLAGSLRSCQRITELLDLFLDIAKLDSGVMPVDKKDAALHSLVRKAVDEQAAAAGAKKIKIEIEIGNEILVRVDPELAYRVVQNILNNAIKFTPEGGRVTLRAAPAAEGMTALSITDTGPGIAPDDLPLIFDRFYQARARREGKIQGNGLGLTFCREALGAMGGSIEVRSQPGAGSTFIVQLPVGLGVKKTAV